MHLYAGHQEQLDGHRGHQREGLQAEAGWAYPTTTSADPHRAAAEWAYQRWMWGDLAAVPADGWAARRRGDSVWRQQGVGLTGPERWKLPGRMQPRGERPDAGARRRWAGCW